MQRRWRYKNESSKKMTKLAQSGQKLVCIMCAVVDLNTLVASVDIVAHEQVWPDVIRYLSEWLQ